MAGEQVTHGPSHHTVDMRNGGSGAVNESEDSLNGPPHQAVVVNPIENPGIQAENNISELPADSGFRIASAGSQAAVPAQISLDVADHASLAESEPPEYVDRVASTKRMYWRLIWQLRYLYMLPILYVLIVTLSPLLFVGPFSREPAKVKTSVLIAVVIASVVAALWMYVMYRMRIRMLNATLNMGLLADTPQQDLLGVIRFDNPLQPAPLYDPNAPRYDECLPAYEGRPASITISEPSTPSSPSLYDRLVSRYNDLTAASRDRIQQPSRHSLRALALRSHRSGSTLAGQSSSIQSTAQSQRPSDPNSATERQAATLGPQTIALALAQPIPIEIHTPSLATSISPLENTLPPSTRPPPPPSPTPSHAQTVATISHHNTAAPSSSVVTSPRLFARSSRSLRQYIQDQQQPLQTLRDVHIRHTTMAVRGSMELQNLSMLSTLSATLHSVTVHSSSALPVDTSIMGYLTYNPVDALLAWYFGPVRISEARVSEEAYDREARRQRLQARRRMRAADEARRLRSERRSRGSMVTRGTQDSTNSSGQRNSVGLGSSVHFVCDSDLQPTHPPPLPISSTGLLPSRSLQILIVPAPEESVPIAL